MPSLKWYQVFQTNHILPGHTVQGNYTCGLECHLEESCPSVHVSYECSKPTL